MNWTRHLSEAGVFDRGSSAPSPVACGAIWGVALIARWRSHSELFVAIAESGRALVQMAPRPSSTVVFEELRANGERIEKHRGVVSRAAF